MAIVSYEASVDLLARHENEIDALPSFPDELRGPLHERIAMPSWGWQRCWKALEALGESASRKGDFTQNDLRRADRIIEALAQYPDELGERVLDVIREEWSDEKSEMLDWLHPQIVGLAGELKLDAAIPVLIDNLHNGDDWLCDASIRALSRIGTDRVVRAIAEDWWLSDENFRGAAVEVLGHIQCDLSLEECWEFIQQEEGFDTQLSLGHTLLSHFSNMAIEPVRQMVLGDDDELEPDQFDLRYKLVATATIMGATFPEYDALYQDALKNNWGWQDYEPGRLADAFRPDAIEPSNDER